MAHASQTLASTEHNSNIHSSHLGKSGYWHEHHCRLLRPSSLVRRLAAVAARHQGAGHDSPAGHELVRRAVAGLRRSRGTAPLAKAALVTAQLAVICAALQARAAPPPSTPVCRCVAGAEDSS
jgi:hypothetical protein